MKFVLLLFLLAGCHITVSAQKMDCKRVHDGNFRIRFKIGEDSYVTKIIRKGGKQTEITAGKGTVVESTVKWTSDCSYELSNFKLIKGQKPFGPEDRILFVRITSLSTESYTIDVTASYTDFKATYEVFIIK